MAEGGAEPLNSKVVFRALAAGAGSAVPDAQEQPTAMDIGAHRLQRTRILGGLINDYRYAA